MGSLSTQKIGVIHEVSVLVTRRGIIAPEQDDHGAWVWCQKTNPPSFIWNRANKRSSDLTNFTFDGQNVLMDDDSVSGISTYQNGLGIDARLKVSGPASTSYFLADHLGSTNGLTDATGSLTASTSYDSFGNATNSSFPTRYQFTGREYDPTIGLQYSRARWYDPSIGRFISEDPIGFGGGDINLFGYVWNNPQNFYDPSGLDGWGNDFADWADKQIENARRYYQPDVSDWWTNGVNNTVADVSHGVANWFRVGNGLGHALYCEDNIYGKAAYIAMDVERAAGIAGTVLSVTAPRFSSAPSWAANPDGPFLPDEYYSNRLNNRAPPEGPPYGIYERFDANGNVHQVTTYDQFGSRIRQYDLGPNARHGEGYHQFDYNSNFPRQQNGGGVRSPQINF